MISWKFIPRDIGLLIGGCLMLYYFVEAIRQRKTSIGLGKTYARANNPISYWVIVGIYAGLGIFCLVGFLIHRM